MKRFRFRDRNSRIDRIDRAVGGILRLARGLPLDSLLLVREEIDKAVKRAHQFAESAVRR